MERHGGVLVEIGTRIRLSGGYDHEPAWLSGRRFVLGNVVAWIPGQNEQPACVVELDEALTAEGDVRGQRSTVTGRYVVLELRYVGASWEDDGVVHVELCHEMPDQRPWAERDVGAWVESHATYEASPGM